MASPDINKDSVVLDFLTPLLQHHRASIAPRRPFILGLTGLQGSGKSYLVSSLAGALSSAPYNYNVAVFSIDDIYHPFSKLEELRLSHPENKLLSHRGEPGTHDIELARETFESLLSGRDTPIPSFDKSLNSGKGDRVPRSEWNVVKGPVDMVIFEGWCVGFRAISDEEVETKWKSSRDSGNGVIGRHGLQDILWINERLKGYDVLTDKFDAFVHLDAEKLDYVYGWRLEQEHNLIKKKGTGMTDDQVVAFIDGYIPGYELYLEKAREGVIRQKGGEKLAGRNLQVVMGKNRETLSTRAF
ncbi:hypothetical protein H072_5281 [Dactylellina haptotyla CBS 200.50]|uniref:Phosphoribulokinase/uridine kinase domain-containing protein n=1 Tax=Dactylellina haptotyla (strain CBS 200.50) TaxID=1284197 RepID=S8AD56_DACHA|nr:hypothetical protein H072_5281 [Dactylellina haptotyla CBS 200.50]